MNRSQKGKLMENKVAENLKNLGYDILFKSIRVKFNRIDFANAVDIVACKKAEDMTEENRLLFIQVKSKKHKSIAIKQLYDFYLKYKLKGYYQAWLYDKKKNFDIVRVIDV